MDLLLAAGIVLLLGGTAFAWGGVRLREGLLFAAASAVLAIVQAARAARRPRPLDPALVAVAALAAIPLLVGALELVPLPRPLVRALAPTTADLYEKDERAGAQEARPRPLSLEPATSRRALLRGAALVALFLLSASLSSRSRNAKALVLALCALACVVAFAGFEGVAAEASSKAPSPWAKRAHSPFWNPNNLAAFLEILLPLGIGAFLARPKTNERAPLSLHVLAERPDLAARGLGLLAAAAAGAAIVQSQSRAGALAAGLGAVAAALLARDVTRRSAVPLVVLGLVLLLGVAWPSADTGQRLGKGIAREDLAGRVVWWHAAAAVLEGRTLTGSGLGTFDPLSFAHLEPSSEVLAAPVYLVRAERAHNDYLNLATDLGVPAAVLGICSVIMAAWVVGTSAFRSRGKHRALAAGALGGVLAALAHAFVDFGLEIPAIAGAFAVSFGIAWGSCRASEADEGAEDARREPHGRGGLRALHAASVVALALLALLAFKEALGAARADEIEALEASLGREPARVDLQTARDASSRARDAVALVPDDYSIEEKRSRFLAIAADHASDLKKADLALALRLEAVDAARNAARWSPARASAQGTLALKLLDAARALDTAPVATGTRAERSMRALELRNEGEARLALAFTLGPTYPDLLFAAGSYYVYKTAATGKRADFELAREYLLGACALQSNAPPSYRASARRLLELEKARLGAYADELGAALEDGPRK